MKSKQILSSACALALLAQSSVGILAQDKGAKAEKKPEQVEQTVFIRNGSVIDASGAPGQATFHFQEPQGGTIAVPGNAGTINWVSGSPQTGENVFQFVASGVSFDSRLVKGAPMSADIYSESVQTLPDGNRIVQKSEGRVFRDSQGRTRHERQLQAFGASGATARQSIQITDPVAGTTYVLDPENKTATKVGSFIHVTGTGLGSGTATATFKSDSNGSFVVSNAGTGAQNASGAPKQVTVSGGVLQGSANKRVQPVYPAVAKAAKAAGTVQVQVKIDETGNVSEAQAINGHPLLRDAAVEAARQWQFKPTELSGAAVKVQGILTFNFVLQEDTGEGTASATSAAVTSTVTTGGGVSAAPTFNSAAPTMVRRVAGTPALRADYKTETLGKEVIEGVECEHTRSVTTLPAGAIGNENPIETVRDSWYSPELKMTILTKTKDPRFGESTYRVTNINRAEPDASLFQVPSDYTIKEGGMGVGKLQQRIPAELREKLESAVRTRQTEQK